MKTIRTHLFFFQILLLMAGCSSVEEPVSLFGDLSGLVTDFDSGKSISGATVSLGGGASVKTDSQGHYIFSDLDPATYTVSVSALGYQPSSRTIAVKANYSAQCDISLKRDIGQISLSVSSLDFGTNSSTTNVEVSNTGNTPVTITMLTDKDWLIVSPQSLDIPTGTKGNVTVSIERSRFTTPGSYSSNVKFSFDGGSVSLPVVCQATESQVNGNLISTLDELVFSKDEMTKFFVLRNTGSITVSYDISLATTDTPWISFNPSNGRINTESEQKVTVAVDRSKIKASGQVMALLNVKYADNAKMLQVTVKVDAGEVSKPDIVLSSLTLESFNAVQVKGRIHTIGSHPVSDYGLCYGIDPDVSLENRQCKTVSLGTAMVAGDVEKTITGLENNRTIYFRLYATNAIGTSYSEIKSILMPDNVGDVTGTITNSITKMPVSRALVSIGSASTMTDASGFYKLSTLPVGAADIYISCDGYISKKELVTVSYLKTITANFSIDPAIPSATVSPLSLDFGADRDRLSFDIENTGGTILNYSVTTGCEWVSSILPSTGSIGVEGTASVTVLINRNVFKEKGTHTASLKVETEAGEVVVQLSVMVGVLIEPTVVISKVSEVTHNRAVVFGSVTGIGSNIVTEYGICLSNSKSAPTVDDICVKVLSNVNAPLDFSIAVENLTPGETYNVRTYAKSMAGTVYSSTVKTFTTNASISGNAGGNGSADDFIHNDW